MPMAAVFFDGGDATFSEFFYWKNRTKQLIREQLVTPFEYFAPQGIFVDAPKSKLWKKMLNAYGDMMIDGSKQRKKRKKLESDSLRACLSTVRPNDMDSALTAVKRAFASIERTAVSVYGAPFVETWELLNDTPFWNVVEKVSKKTFSKK